MKLKIDDLGVVGITVDDWSFEKSFKPKTIVTNYLNWRTYISRRAVPKHIELEDTYYWKPILKPYGDVKSVQSDWDQDDENQPDYIKNKPNIETGGDRPYNPEIHSGLGRKTLQLKEDGSNILTQEDFDQENTIYVIAYDFDLNGAVIEIPEGCILEFDGGSLSNGTIIGNNTIIDGVVRYNNVLFNGKWYTPDKKEIDVAVQLLSGTQYIWNQSQFDIFLEEAKTSGHQDIRILLSDGTFKMPTYRNGEFLNNILLGNIELIGNRDTIFDFSNIIVERKDGEYYSNTHYRVRIPELTPFSIFTDENDKLIPVREYSDVDRKPLMTTSKISDYNQSDRSFKLSITGDLKNRTFDKAYGVIIGNWHYTYFTVLRSDDQYFYCKSVYGYYDNYDSLNFTFGKTRDRVSGALPTEHPDYVADGQGCIFYLLFNTHLGGTDSVYYDNEYLYIPNSISKVKCILKNSTVKNLEVKADSVGSTEQHLSISHIKMRNANYGVLCPTVQSNKIYRVSVEECEFENIGKDSVSIADSGSNAQSYLITSIQRCQFINNCISDVSEYNYCVIDNYINRDNATIEYVAARLFSSIDVVNCYFKNDDVPYYPCPSVGVTSFLSKSYTINQNELINFQFCAIMVGYGNGGINRNNIHNTDGFNRRNTRNTALDGGSIYLQEMWHRDEDAVNNTYKAAVNENRIYNVSNFISPQVSVTSRRGIFFDGGRGQADIYSNIIIGKNLMYAVDMRDVTNESGRLQGYTMSSNGVRVQGNVFDGKTRFICGSGVASNDFYVGGNVFKKNQPFLYNSAQQMNFFIDDEELIVDSNGKISLPYEIWRCAPQALKMSMNMQMRNENIFLFDTGKILELTFTRKKSDFWYSGNNVRVHAVYRIAISKFADLRIGFDDNYNTYYFYVYGDVPANMFAPVKFIPSGDSLIVRIYKVVETDDSFMFATHWSGAVKVEQLGTCSHNISVRSIADDDYDVFSDNYSFVVYPKELYTSKIRNELLNRLLHPREIITLNSMNYGNPTVSYNKFGLVRSNGSTAQQPTFAYGDDGFSYYDTNLEKTKFYKTRLGDTILTQQVDEDIPVKIPNTLTYWDLYYVHPSESGVNITMYFCENEGEDEGEKYVVITERNNEPLTFMAPDNEKYKYIVFKSDTDNTHINVDYVNHKWVEEGGIKLGTKRSGTFSEAPTIADNIKTGFMFMLVDGNDNFPLYAKVESNTVLWYKADGTQYNG